MTTHPKPASLARRALPAIAVLGASGAILTQLGGTSEGATLATTATGSTGATVGGASRTPTTTVTPPTTTRPRTTTGGSSAGATSPTTTRPATTPAASGGSSTAGAACTGATYTGQAFSNKYGQVQVAATVSADKTLCDVQVLVYPDGDRKSVSINQRALPTLRTEALAAHSAKIAGVTGATLTSNGYKSSLQSALDQVK